MKLVITDYVEPDLDWEKEKFKEMNVNYSFYQMKNASPDELLKKIADADIIIVNMAKITRKVLSQLEKCKLIIRHGVGYDNVDIASASEFNIVVANVPDYCSAEVAEQASMLLLLTYRKFVQQTESVALSINKREWNISPVPSVKRLAGKSAGIIGCGRIGQRVLRIMQALDLKVLVHDPYLKRERLIKLGISNSSLKEVLTQSDLISIHCTLNSKTFHMIGEKELRMMKPTAVIVNTARGGIIEVEALAKACKQKWIAGAAMDVFEHEPPQESFPLIGLKNVILTPHISWYSEDAAWDIRKKIVEDVWRFVRGQMPRFPLNLEQLRQIV